LGHIVSHEGIKVDPNETLKNLRGFVGLMSYYQKFVKDYGRIATPLKTLLKKDAFSWTQEVTQDFEKLKEVMCRTLILATHDFTIFFYCGV